MIGYGVYSYGSYTSSTVSSSSPLSLLSPSLSSFYSSGYSLIWISGVGWVVENMEVGSLLPSNTPKVISIALLVAAALAVVLGPSISVYMAAKGPRVSSSSTNSGNSAANPGWIPVYVYIRSSRSYLVYH